MKVTPQELVEGLKSDKRYVTEKGEFTMTSFWVKYRGCCLAPTSDSLKLLLDEIEVTVIEPEPDVIVRLDAWGESESRPGYKITYPVITAKSDSVDKVEKALKELAEGKL